MSSYLNYMQGSVSMLRKQTYMCNYKYFELKSTIYFIYASRVASVKNEGCGRHKVWFIQISYAKLVQLKSVRPLITNNNNQ